MHLLEYVHAFGAYLLPFLVLILILVVTHELGHFLAARSLGISVAEFAVGFGPLVLGRTDREGCMWSIRLVPLGGFVRFVGDENATSANVSIPEHLDPDERAGLYHLRPARHRAFVLIAGPAANLLTGVLVLTALYSFYGRQYSPPVLAQVNDGGPAMVAGFKVGDRVLSIDGSPIDRFEQIQRTVAAKPGHRLTFKIERDGKVSMIDVVPAATKLATTIGVELEVGRIGIVSKPAEPEKVSPLAALRLGAGDIWFFTQATITSIGEMAIGARPLDQAGGPIKIVQLSGDSAKHGFPAFVILIAVLSVSLAVFNLLPVPILDGGQIVICAIEGLIRRKPSERIMDVSYKAGFAMVIALLAFVSYNDVAGLYRQAMKPPAPASDAVVETR
jgi:regulator of sigma E protease